MQMSIGKTTRVELEAGNSADMQLSTVGSRVSGKQECHARTKSANVAFNSMLPRLGEPYIVNIRELFLARQYILQYAAFIYRNDCNMRVAHIAIYCIFKYFAIYCQYIAIYCILQQYIVYCDNIQNIATIFSISRQYIAIYRNTSRIHRDVV